MGYSNPGIGSLSHFIVGVQQKVWLEELARHRPAMADGVERAVKSGREDGIRFHPDASSFEAIEGDSIDYAVMENTAHAAMVPADMGWSDIGDWAALQDAMATDESGNFARGAADIVDCRNTMIVSDGPRVSAIGLEDVCVVVSDGEVEDYPIAIARDPSSG